MPHLGVVVDAVAGIEPHRLVELGVQFDGAFQHEQEVVAVVAHPVGEILHRARADARARRHAELVGELGAEKLVHVGRRLVHMPLPGAGHAAASGGGRLPRRRQQFVHVDIEPGRDLLQHVEGRRHLVVLDLRQCRGRKTAAPARLLEREALADADGVHAAAEIEGRDHAQGRPALREPIRRLGFCHPARLCRGAFRPGHADCPVLRRNGTG